MEKQDLKQAEIDLLNQAVNKLIPFGLRTTVLEDATNYLLDHSRKKGKHIFCKPSIAALMYLLMEKHKCGFGKKTTAAFILKCDYNNFPKYVRYWKEVTDLGQYE